jgi:hypothetical protein
MKKPHLIILILIVFGLSCTKKSKVTSNGAPQDPPGPAIQLSSYPLNVGNMWVYDNGDTIRAVADTTIGGMNATKMVKTNKRYSAIFFCANTEDGFYVVASNWTHALEGFTCPIDAGSGGGPDILLATPPVLFAKYPIDTANAWDAHVPGYNHFMRQWNGYFTVSTRAGKFNCARMSTGMYTEYYSSKGLVQTVEYDQCDIAPCPVIVTKLIYVNF